MTAAEAAPMLEMANSVVIIPGYSMVVAQAQHRVAELYQRPEQEGIDIRFPIQPAAGGMPGHMNVLLAEADVPYDQLVEIEDINPEMPQVDVVLGVSALLRLNQPSR